MTSESINVLDTVTIDEGKIYKTSSILIPAGALATQDEMDKIVASGGTPLHKAVALINHHYKAKGYLDVVVTPHPEFNDADATVKYTMEISAGAVYQSLAS